jgi:hypothetical protein
LYCTLPVGSRRNPPRSTSPAWGSKCASQVTSMSLGVEFHCSPPSSEKQVERKRIVSSHFLISFFFLGHTSPSQAHTQALVCYTTSQSLPLSSHGATLANARPWSRSIQSTSLNDIPLGGLVAFGRPAKQCTITVSKQGAMFPSEWLRRSQSVCQ